MRPGAARRGSGSSERSGALPARRGRRRATGPFGRRRIRRCGGPDPPPSRRGPARPPPDRPRVGRPPDGRRHRPERDLGAARPHHPVVGPVPLPDPHLVLPTGPRPPRPSRPAPQRVHHGPLARAVALGAPGPLRLHLRSGPRDGPGPRHALVAGSVAERRGRGQGTLRRPGPSAGHRGPGPHAAGGGPVAHGAPGLPPAHAHHRGRASAPPVAAVLELEGNPRPRCGLRRRDAHEVLLRRRGGRTGGGDPRSRGGGLGGLPCRRRRLAGGPRGSAQPGRRRRLGPRPHPHVVRPELVGHRRLPQGPGLFAGRGHRRPPDPGALRLLSDRNRVQPVLALGGPGPDRAGLQPAQAGRVVPGGPAAGRGHRNVPRIVVPRPGSRWWRPT